MNAIKKTSKSKKSLKRSEKRDSVISKAANSKELEEKARKFDELVSGMLKAKAAEQERLLIFHHDKGFVYSDLENLGKYSIRL